MWAKPRKVNEVPFVSGWLVPFGRLLRKSTKRVLSGWSISPYRARRLPKTPRTRLASKKSSNASTASSAKRIRVHLPLRRERTSNSNHSSSTWCRKMFERQGEITPPCGEPSVAWCRRPSSRTPAFSHLSIIRRITPSVTRWSRKSATESAAISGLPRIEHLQHMGWRRFVNVDLDLGVRRGAAVERIGQHRFDHRVDAGNANDGALAGAA